MSKITLDTVTSGYNSITTINENFQTIQTTIDNTLSRDGTSPNTMSADLDMNGYRILNQLAQSGEGFSFEGAWVTATSYQMNNLVTQSGSCYICTIDHTSGTFATDLSAGKWSLLASKGDAGAGTGDVLAANNLSEYTASAATARSNITAAKSGANSDISSLTGLTTPLDETLGGTGLTTLTAGDTLYASATNTLAKLAKGTSLQYLRMNTGATAPEWATLATSGGGVSGETTYNTNTTLSISTDDSYLIRCTVASVVYTFPAATGNEGTWWLIQNATSTDTGIRLVANGSESIGGATGATIYIPAYTTIGFVSDGSNWLVFHYSGKHIWTYTSSGTFYCPPGKYAGVGTVVGGGSSGYASSNGLVGGTTSIGALLTAAGGSAPTALYVAPASPNGTLGKTNDNTVAYDAGGDGYLGVGGFYDVAATTMRAATGYGSGGGGDGSTRLYMAGQGGARRIKEAIAPVPGTAYTITVGAGGASVGSISGAGTAGIAIVELN